MRRHAMALLALLCLLAALTLVYVRHLSRAAFAEWQALAQTRDALEVEWQQLRVEHGAHTSPARIEQRAREQLGMRTPDPAALEWLQR